MAKKKTLGGADPLDAMESLIGGARAAPSADEFLRGGRTTERERAAHGARAAPSAAPDPKRKLSVSLYESDVVALTEVEYRWYREPGRPARRLPAATMLRALLRAAVPLLESLPPQIDEEGLTEALREAIGRPQRGQDREGS